MTSMAGLLETHATQRTEADQNRASARVGSATDGRAQEFPPTERHRAASSLGVCAWRRVLPGFACRACAGEGDT